MKNEVFFGEEGLTSTSANHIANMAKEFVRVKQCWLDKMNFWSESLSIVGSDAKTTVLQIGMSKEELPLIKENLRSIAEANSLIAWLREAIKAKEEMIAFVDKMGLSKFCEIKNLEFPVDPEQPSFLTEKEYYNSLSIKDRNRYFALEAKAATFGKCIHENGSFSSKREKMNGIIANPTTVTAKDNYMAVTNREASFTPEELDEVFFDLQKEYRETQAELNSYKNDCQKAISASTSKSLAEYKQLYAKFTVEINSLQNEFKEYKVEEVKRIGNLKIIIPNDLKDIYSKVSNLGK